MLHSCHIDMNTSVHCIVCLGPCNRSCVARSDPFCHVTIRAVVTMILSPQNMWRGIKRSTKLQVHAGRKSALLLSSQRVKPHFIVESLITPTVKKMLRVELHNKYFWPPELELDPETSRGLTTDDGRRLIARLLQMHTNLGHPSNHALARAIRVAGGSAAASRAALRARVNQHHPGPSLDRYAHGLQLSKRPREREIEEASTRVH